MILGSTGRNFAAGMSGGIAYIWDPEKRFAPRCNNGMVEMESLKASADIDELRDLIERHLKYTGSSVATRILRNWRDEIGHFIKVMPTDYKRVLEERKVAQAGSAANDGIKNTLETSA